MKHWVLDVSLAVLLIWSVCILASVTAEYFKIDNKYFFVVTINLFYFFSIIKYNFN